MDRLTVQNNGVYETEDLRGALERLAAYENLLEALEREQTDIASQMTGLRAAGKEKTVKYREIFAKKLQNAYVLSLFRSL